MREQELHAAATQSEMQQWDAENQTAHDATSAKLTEVEELLSDALPDGWYVKVDQ